MFVRIRVASSTLALCIRSNGGAKKGKVLQMKSSYQIFGNRAPKLVSSGKKAIPRRELRSLQPIKRKLRDRVVRYVGSFNSPKGIKVIATSVNASIEKRFRSFNSPKGIKVIATMVLPVAWAATRNFVSIPRRELRSLQPYPWKTLVGQGIKSRFARISTWPASELSVISPRPDKIPVVLGSRISEPLVLCSSEIRAHCITKNSAMYIKFHLQNFCIASPARLRSTFCVQKSYKLADGLRLHEEKILILKRIGRPSVSFHHISTFAA
jgi:hypothetical protein